MKLRIKAVLALTTILATTPIVQAETLKEALAAAYASNPQLMAQRAALRAVDEGVAAANAGFLPQINGIGQFSRGNIDRKIGDADVFPIDINSDSYTVNVDQNFFNGFQDYNSRKQAVRTVRASREQLVSVEQQVLLDAVTAYMNVLRDEAVVELNQNNIQVLERQLQASRDRFRVGEVTRTDVAQSEARLEGAKSTLLSAEATLAGSRALYQRVIGRPPATLQTPTQSPDIPKTLDEAIEIAVAESPGVKTARYNEEAARYAINSAKGALLPSVGVRASYNRREGITSNAAGSSTVDLIDDQTTVTVQVSVPLYNGGARHSSVRRAKQVRSQRMMEIYQAERSAQEQALVAWDNHRASKGQIVSSEAQVRANEIALEGVRQEAYVGSRTTLDVLNAEQELLNSRVSLVRAQRNESVAAYNLVSAIGRLTARDIGLGVDLYDETAYYDKVNDKFIGLDTKVR